MSPVSESFGLLVIGSGPAGVSAAAAYVEAGGPGPVCLVSADPEPPYQRPPLSKAVLTGEEPAEGRPILEDAGALDRVEVRLATSVAELDLEDRVVRTTDGAELGYERLVVATGARPVALDSVAAGAEVHLLRSLEHARALAGAVAGARTAVVVGSGFIGCEAAASLAQRGLQVSVVSTEERPQQRRLGREVAERIAGWLGDSGVRLLGGQAVESFPDGRTVRLADGTTHRADVVLVAAGVTPDGGLAERAGLATSEGRVLVDAALRTADPHVLAAGDVAMAHNGAAGRRVAVEHWGDAMTMGEVAGANAAGADETWDSAPGFWSEIGEHALKYAAWGDGHDEVRFVDHGGGAFTAWYLSGDEPVVVGVLTHEADDDYERGQQLVEQGAPLEPSPR